jgi:hypothetical protein
MISFLTSLLSGFIAGFIAPYVYQQFIWKDQKRIELKRAAFDEAVDALALHEVDALSPRVQAEAVEHEGLRRKVEIREETLVRMQRARYLIRAFYSQETSTAFSKALDTMVSLETNPSPDYQNNAVAAINLMASELDLSPPAWFRRLLGRMSQPAKLPTP